MSEDSRELFERSPSGTSSRSGPDELHASPSSGTELPVVSDRYGQLELVGVGSFGKIWSAKDMKIDRDVAIKTLISQERKSIRKLKHEAKVMAIAANHGNNMPLFDVDLEGGEPYLVMPLLAFQNGDSYRTASLHDWIGWFHNKNRQTLPLALAKILGLAAPEEPEKQSPIARRRLLTAFSDICKGVGFAHSKWIAHGDIKPNNVLINTLNGQVFLADWGLAVHIDAIELKKTPDEYIQKDLLRLSGILRSIYSYKES